MSVRAAAALDPLETDRIANMQAALRRVATLVAEGAAPDRVLAAVADEVARVTGIPDVVMCKYIDGDTAIRVVALATAGEPLFPVGTRWELDGPLVATEVLRTGRPARIDSYDGVAGTTAATVRAAGVTQIAGAPIRVGGRVWGLVSLSWPGRPLPTGVEHELADFTSLVATAIANAQARDDLRRLAEEQAALRRVATLVARGVPSTLVFESVAEEVGRLLGADAATFSRFESDGTATSISSWARSGEAFPVGMRYEIVPGIVAHEIAETTRPARVNGYDGVPGEGAAMARALGWRSGVGAPVLVAGRLWGMAIVLSKGEDPLPADTEERLTQFTDLLATAVANAEGRAELAASRARIVATADATRQRIERDLHDGAQQRLVSLALELHQAEELVPRDFAELRGALHGVLDGLSRVLDGLREIALGIHPAFLAHGGLPAALKTLASRSAVPVELDLRCGDARPSPTVEIAAYYVVSEALTNAAKHAESSVVHVSAGVTDDGVLHVRVRDDGAGGADPSRGSGLVGLRDRVEAIGGTLSIQSPRGEGTTLSAEFPASGFTPRRTA